MHMKHILPILTLTTLAAAASAQSASGLSYNRVGVNYDCHTQAFGLEASAFIGSSNFLLQAATSIGHNGTANGADLLGVGYVFKNVAYSTDATVSIGSNELYSLNLRRELGAGFEAAANYSRISGANSYGVELAYNLSKQTQLAAGYQHTSNSTSATTLSVRYNF
jgi:hypothetical protein